MARKKIGDVLVEMGIIDAHQLQSALAHQRQWGGKIGRIITELRFATEKSIVDALAKQLNAKVISLRDTPLDPRALKLVPMELARKHGLFPYQFQQDKPVDKIMVAMSDPTDLAALDEVSFRTGKKILPSLASDSDIDYAIRKHYLGEENIIPEGEEDQPLPPPADVPFGGREIGEDEMGDEQAVEVAEEEEEVIQGTAETTSSFPARTAAPTPAPVAAAGDPLASLFDDLSPPEPDPLNSLWEEPPAAEGNGADGAVELADVGGSGTGRQMAEAVDVVSLSDEEASPDPLAGEMPEVEAEQPQDAEPWTETPAEELPVESYPEPYAEQPGDAAAEPYAEDAVAVAEEYQAAEEDVPVAEEYAAPAEGELAPAEYAAEAAPFEEQPAGEWAATEEEPVAVEDAPEGQAAEPAYEEQAAYAEEPAYAEAPSEEAPYAEAPSEEPVAVAEEAPAEGQDWAEPPAQEEELSLAEEPAPVQEEELSLAEEPSPAQEEELSLADEPAPDDAAPAEEAPADYAAEADAAPAPAAEEYEISAAEPTPVIHDVASSLAAGQVPEGADAGRLLAMLVRALIQKGLITEDEIREHLSG